MKLSNTSLRVVVLTWCAFAGQVCLAIDPHRAMSQYVRDHWGNEQGLPRGSIYAITQTADGYLWIGSDAGLIRFDGLQFRLMPDPTKLLGFKSVVGIAPDKEGLLWVRLSDRTLLRYRDNRFENPFPDPDPHYGFTAMDLTRDGELLAAPLQLGAFTGRAGAFVPLAPATGIPRSPVLSIAQTGDGAIWLGTRGAGLFRLAGGKTFDMSTGLPDPKVNCLLPDGAQDMWIGTDNGIALWNGKEITSHGIPAALRSMQILTLLKDRDANLWVGTDSGGVLRINGDDAASLDPGLYTDRKEVGSAVTALFEDRERSLWIGSADGLQRLRDSPFITFSAPEGLPTDGSNPVFVDADNRLWFPPVTGGLWWWKDGRHGSVRQAGLENDVVYSIAGGSHELWLGRQRGGLTRLSLPTAATQGAFDATSYTRANGLAQNSVYSVYRDRAGVVWAGTLSGGVSKLDQGRFTTYTHADGLASNTVASILQGTDQTMWFATPSGLSSLAQSRWRTFTASDGLPSENINCLLEDSAGVLWAGTTAGLAFRGGGVFHVPPRAHAALTEQILGLAEDAYGWLWITTSNHVLRVNGPKLKSGGLTDIDVVEYGVADGLRGVEGVKRHLSVFKDSRGLIWISLNRGISVVDPARLTSSSAPAMPHIQGISADGLPLEISGSVRVPPRRQRIVFDYSGLSLALPERVRFRYMLENFDRGWSVPVYDRQAAYTNLGPGSYRFRVVATNHDGVWSDREAAIAFQVEPAFWQTWWFSACGVVLVALAAMVLYRLRMRHLTDQLNIRFEERLSERTRIAQDLHDTLLQGFLSASMQVHVATDRLPIDSHVKPAFKQALDLMRQVIEEGRNAVRGLRSTGSASLDLEDAFSQIQDELTSEELPGEPADFRIIVEGERRPLHPLIRDEVYRIGREALTNAFRHSGGKTIEMELNYAAKGFRVLIRDDGRGIEPRILDAGRNGHWGLSGMRERADRIGARLRLWSSASAGTEVELTIPGNIAYRSRKAELVGRPDENEAAFKENVK